MVLPGPPGMARSEEVHRLTENVYKVSPQQVPGAAAGRLPGLELLELSDDRVSPPRDARGQSGRGARAAPPGPALGKPALGRQRPLGHPRALPGHPQRYRGIPGTRGGMSEPGWAALSPHHPRAPALAALPQARALRAFPVPWSWGSSRFFLSAVLPVS